MKANLGPMVRTALASLTPRQQLRAGRTTRRLVQLAVGLTLYGVSMGMMVRSGLGLDPWDVFHYGIAQHLPVSFGTVTIIVGVAVLVLWIPLRQWPGLGTVANVIVIGLATDATLSLLDAPDLLAARVVLLVGGIVLKISSGAPDVARHEAHLAKGTATYDAFSKLADALTLTSLLPLAVFCVLTAVVALRTGALPAWLGVGAGITGAALAVNSAFIGATFVPAMLVFLLWSLVTSIQQVRAGSGRRAAVAPAEVPAH